MTYAQICGEYNTRMRTIDKFLEAVQENYIAVVAEIRHDVMMNESFEDPYFLEAKAQKKIEEANTQVQEKGKQASKGILQTFVDFVNKLVEKVKSFFTAKKIDEVKETIEKSPELQERVVEGVVDEQTLRNIIMQRRKLANEILRKYEREGAKLTAEDLDDLVTARQKQINEAAIKNRKKMKLGAVVGLLAKLTASVGATAFFAAINRKIDARQREEEKEWRERNDKRLEQGQEPEKFKKSGNVVKHMAGATAIGTGLSSVGQLVTLPGKLSIANQVKKHIAELEKQNKLLESEEIRKLTLQISQAAIDDRAARKSKSK